MWLALLACGPAAALCTGVCTCSASATAVAFGSAWSPISGAAQASTGNVRVTCGGVLGVLIPISVSLSAGQSGDAMARRMVAGSQSLAYNLYTDSGYGTVWGNGAAGTQTVSGSILINVLSGTSLDLPVYGRIPGSQPGVRAGSYADTITVTITYN